MDKPTPAALAAYDAAFPDDARAVRKKMFGMPAGFVNGNLFFSVFEDRLVLRPSPEALAALRDRDGVAHFEPLEGRPWKDYLAAAADRWGGSPELSEWAREALEYTASLPPKAPKKRG